MVLAAACAIVASMQFPDYNKATFWMVASCVNLIIMYGESR